MSRIVEGKELSDLAPIIDAVRKEAGRSNCNKDHRGAVVYRGEEILGIAHNGPAFPRKCEIEKCFDVCGLFANHAERMALIDALDKSLDLNGASIIHVKVDDDSDIQISGKLRCEDCTGFMMRFLRKGTLLKEFILMQEDGWTAYEVDEADEVTRRNLGLG